MAQLIVTKPIGAGLAKFGVRIIDQLAMNLAMSYTLATDAGETWSDSELLGQLGLQRLSGTTVPHVAARIREILYLGPLPSEMQSTYRRRAK